MNLPDGNGICFCRAQPDEDLISCSNKECPYMDFHRSCLALDTAVMPNTWYCPHCSRLPQFKRRKNVKLSGLSSATNQAALLCDTICIANLKQPWERNCQSVMAQTVRVVIFFHLKCLGFKRMPNNYRTIWQCSACKQPDKSDSPPTTCASSADDTSSSLSAYQPLHHSSQVILTVTVKMMLR